MLQYDLKLTVKKYDEKTSEKIAEFDWDEGLAKEAKEKLEILLQSLVFVPDKGSEVYVFSISNLSRVE